MRVLVLGAGFGGLELTTRLSEEFGSDVEVVLIDQSDGFVFGFSKLDVMFGRTEPAAVRHPYRDLVKPGVRFVQTTIRSIDPIARRVQTDAGGDSLESLTEIRLNEPVASPPRPAVELSDQIETWVRPMAPSETHSKVIITTTSGARDARISAVALTMKPAMPGPSTAAPLTSHRRCAK